MNVPSKARILYDNAVKAIEDKKYKKAMGYLSEALQIAPNYPEATSALYFVSQKMQENTSKLLGLIQKLNFELKTKEGEPFQIPQEYISELEQSIKQISSVSGSTLNIYKWFRDWQFKAKELSEKDPNDKFKKKISNINLSNLQESIEFLTDLKNKYPDNKNLASIIQLCSILVEKGVLTFIPYLIQKNIRQTILKLSMKYSRIQVAEIAEKCDESEDTIIIIIKSMIEAGEIYADYYRSTKAVLFDQQKSVNDLDILMEKFELWENNYCKNCNRRIQDPHQKICEFCGEKL
jgi:tetratricopeptide (TPR) repeat protein